MTDCIQKVSCKWLFLNVISWIFLKFTETVEQISNKILQFSMTYTHVVLLQIHQKMDELPF